MSNILSLEELSFDCVKNNLSIFLTDYRSNESENLKKCLLFLQRVYTQRLFDEFEMSKKWKKDHLEFLLNAKLSRLNIEIVLSNLYEDEIFPKVFPIVSNLKEISLPDYCVDSYECSASLSILERIIPFCKNLEKVVLPSVCHNKLLKTIVTSCPRLNELDIRNSYRVSDKGLKAICCQRNGEIQARCPIKRLILQTLEGVSNECVAFLLRHLHTLEEVQYEELFTAIEYSHNFTKGTFKSNLLSLDLSHYGEFWEHNYVTEILSICTKACPKLKKLNVHIYRVEDLRMVASFSELKILFLRVSDRKIDLKEFLACKGKQLKHLRLECSTLPLKTLLENCSNLEYLELDIENINEDESTVQTLAILHGFEFRAFKQKFAFDTLMKLVFASVNLQFLYISCAFNDFDVEEFLRYSLNCNLKHLKLHCSIVGLDFLKQFILNCVSIEVLTLNQCVNLREGDYDQLRQFIKQSNRRILIDF